jgi:xanthine dehydrogenase accessory factor
MREIYDRLSELLEKKSICVLATIVTQSGSSPRGPGTKMLMLKDGSFVGTIGGGRLEKAVLDAGREVFKSLTPFMLLYRMQGEDVDANEMICGGYASIFIEPVLPDNRDTKSIIDEARALNKRGGSAVIATVLDPGYWKQGFGTRMFIKSASEKIGSLDCINRADEIIQLNMREIIARRVPHVMALRGKDDKN